MLILSNTLSQFGNRSLFLCFHYSVFCVTIYCMCVDNKLISYLATYMYRGLSEGQCPLHVGTKCFHMVILLKMKHLFILCLKYLK